MVDASWVKLKMKSAFLVGTLAASEDDGFLMIDSVKNKEVRPTAIHRMHIFRLNIAFLSYCFFLL